MPQPDAVYLGHMLIAIEGIGKITGTTDRQAFNRDRVLLVHIFVTGFCIGQ